MRVEKISAVGSPPAVLSWPMTLITASSGPSVPSPPVRVGPWPGVAGVETVRTTPNFVTDGLVRTAYSVWSCTHQTHSRPPGAALTPVYLTSPVVLRVSLVLVPTCQSTTFCGSGQPEAYAAHTPPPIRPVTETSWLGSTECLLPSSATVDSGAGARTGPTAGQTCAALMPCCASSWTPEYQSAQAIPVFGSRARLTSVAAPVEPRRRGRPWAGRSRCRGAR